MLEHGIDAVPARHRKKQVEDGKATEWYWIEASNIIARQRENSLNETVAETLENRRAELRTAMTVAPEEAIEVVARALGTTEPAVLVAVESSGSSWDGVVGIVTAFDLMTIGH